MGYYHFSVVKYNMMQDVKFINYLFYFCQSDEFGDSSEDEDENSTIEKPSSGKYSMIVVA